MASSDHIPEAARFLNFFLTRGPTDSLSYADHWAVTQQTINWTKPFVAYARAHYDSLMIPFLDAALSIHPPIMSPHWQQFAELHARASIQDMLQGRRGVRETHEQLQEILSTMHGEE